MSLPFPSRIALGDDSGQMIPWMTLVFALSIGMGGLTVDLGRVFVSYNVLQTSTDAAALSAAYNLALPTATASSVQSAASSLSSASGGANAKSYLQNVAVSTTFKCLNSIGLICTALSTGVNNGYNAVQVTQTASVQSYFIQVLSVFGAKNSGSMNLKVTSTAAMHGATNAPYNIAIILDGTGSMSQNDTDASCGSTRISCAMQGVRTLLQSLSPCAPSSPGSGCTAFDEVSLFAFPNVQIGSSGSGPVLSGSSCPTNLTHEPYTMPSNNASSYTPVTTTVGGGFTADYQLTGFSYDYISTNQANGPLSTTSTIVVAVGGKSGCKGFSPPSGEGTFYAGAIYAAQSALTAMQASPGRAGSQNAIVILSDGDATPSKSNTLLNVSNNAYATNTGNAYGSSIDECAQGVSAAQAATKAGTTVYTIAYGAASSGCSTDSGLTPCQAMQKMASAPANFYSDATASANKGQCLSTANPSLTINQIFQQVVNSFTVSRLIPNNAT